MTTTEIIDEFTAIIAKDQDYTLAELKTILTDVYNTKTGKKIAKNVEKKVEKVEDAPSDGEEKPKKRGRKAKAPAGEEKKKREPTAYNIYIKEKHAELKISNPEMSAKERLIAGAAAWTAQKTAGNV